MSRVQRWCINNVGFIPARLQGDERTEEIGHLVPPDSLHGRPFL